MKSKDKALFRKTIEWKEYRKEIIEERGCYCECCGMKNKKLSLHHKDLNVNNYKDLTDKTKHSLLCSRCHSFLHHIHTQTFKKSSNQNNADLLNICFNFFIFTPEQIKEIKNRFTYCSCCGKYKNTTRNT